MRKAMFKALFTVLLLGTAPVLQAQAEGTEQERKKAAKAEQEQLQQQAESEAGAEAAKTESTEESSRLEKLGLKPEDAPPEERKGFFVQIDAYFAEPGGFDRAVARLGDVTSSAASADAVDSQSADDPMNPTPGYDLADQFTVENSRELSLAYDSVATPQLEMGWRLPESRGAISLRYWAISGDADASASATRTFVTGDPARGDLIVGGIDNQGFENTRGAYEQAPEDFARLYGSPRLVADNLLAGADSVSASGTYDAARIDLTWSRSMVATKRLDFGWRAGLAYAEVQRSEAATFEWRSFERGRVFKHALAVESVSSSSDTSAIGPVVGGHVRFALTTSRRWSVRLGVELAALKSSAKTTFKDSQILSQDGLPPQAPRVYQDVSNDGSGDMLSTIDADLALEFRIGANARLALGWREARWDGAITEERFPSASNLALLEQETKDVTFGGPYLRFGFFF